jgi:hypothetical protein
VCSSWLLGVLLPGCGAPNSDPARIKDETSGGSSSGGDTSAGGNSVSGGSGGTSGAGGSGGSTNGGSGGGGTGGGSGVPNDPNAPWQNVTGNLAGTPSDCGTIPYVTTKPGENLVVVGVVKQGVFASTDSGTTWSKLGTGAGSDDFTAGLAEVIFDPEDSNRWWLAGVRYGSPFRSDDNGLTLTKLGDFPQNDGIAVDLADPERKTILVGGHEQVQEVRYSSDGGANWSNIGASLPADSNHSSFPYIVDDSTFLVGTAANRVYRTTDKGASWTKVVDGGGGSDPLKHSDGSLYWAARDTGGVVRSTDDGVTWDTVTPNGTVYGMIPIELPDGRIAMRGPSGMLVTADQGATWEPVSPPVPNDYWWFTSTYNAVDRAFYTSRFACDGSTVVNDDAVMRFAWDYAQ